MFRSGSSSNRPTVSQIRFISRLSAYLEMGGILVYLLSADGSATAVTLLPLQGKEAGMERTPSLGCSQNLLLHPAAAAKPPALLS